MQAELRLRIFSAAVLGVIVLAATWFGGPAFRLVVALFALLIYFEWSVIVRPPARRRWLEVFGWLAIAAIAVSIMTAGPALALRVALVSILLAGLAGLATGRALWTACGVGYAGFAAIALAAIRDEGAGGLIAILFLFAVVWATDIAAFFCGRAIGGPRLAPAISPSKTWSGAIGGVLAGVLAGSLVIALAARLGLAVPAIAAVLSVASQFGDLFESWVKRHFGVKDSGRLIPGHGGVMDRIDGLVFAALTAYAMAAMWSRFAPAGWPEAGPIAGMLGL